MSVVRFYRTPVHAKVCRSHGVIGDLRVFRSRSMLAREQSLGTSISLDHLSGKVSISIFRML
jgi:hypothetical protein